MAEESVDVQVAGAGLGGLSATLTLARQVRVLTVDRHPGTSIHPRASGQTPRTMGLYRYAGIDGEVLGVSKRASQGLRITVAASLDGPVFHRILEDASGVGITCHVLGEDFTASEELFLDR